LLGFLIVVIVELYDTTIRSTKDFNTRRPVIALLPEVDDASS